MSLHGSTALAAVLSLFGASPAQAAGGSNFFLRVGPGINATVRTASMHLSCSDDASCRFEVPPNSAFDVVASGGAGHPLRWTGCNAQSEGNRCRVQVRDAAVRITIR
jgi:hypothetical protein